MAYIDDEIGKMDLVIDDLNTVMQQKADEGLTLGDYDLQTETARRGKQREAEAARKAEAERQGIRKPVSSDKGYTVKETLDWTPEQIQAFQAKKDAEKAAIKADTDPRTTKFPMTSKEAFEQRAQDDWWKEKRAVLKDKLFEEFPNAKERYNEITKLPVKDRIKYFDELTENYQLKKKDIVNALGSEKDYKRFMDLTKEGTSKYAERHPEISGYYNVFGKGGAETTDPLFGLRMATIYDHPKLSRSEIMDIEEGKID